MPINPTARRLMSELQALRTKVKGLSTKRQEARAEVERAVALANKKRNDAQAIIAEIAAVEAEMDTKAALLKAAL